MAQDWMIGLLGAIGMLDLSKAVNMEEGKQEDR